MLQPATVGSVLAAGNATKAAGNTISTNSSNPMSNICQAIGNGLKGLGNMITGGKKQKINKNTNFFVYICSCRQKHLININQYV